VGGKIRKGRKSSKRKEKGRGRKSGSVLEGTGEV